jgi:hypothetical protein
LEKEKDAVPEEKKDEDNPKEDEKDLLYTHKPESRGGAMQWNSSLCRRPGH